MPNPYSSVRFSCSPFGFIEIALFLPRQGKLGIKWPTPHNMQLLLSQAPSDVLHDCLRALRSYFAGKPLPPASSVGSSNVGPREGLEAVAVRSHSAFSHAVSLIVTLCYFFAYFNYFIDLIAFGSRVGAFFHSPRKTHHQPLSLRMTTTTRMPTCAPSLRMGCTKTLKPSLPCKRHPAPPNTMGTFLKRRSFVFFDGLSPCYCHVH
jgi:hypothetical protein